MNIVWTLLIGLVIGLVARMVKPGNDSMGLIGTTLVGVGGSFVGTFGAQAMGLAHAGQAAGFLAGVAGAIVLLIVLSVVRRS